MRGSHAFVVLAVLAGAVLAATVFRDDIAQAKALAQSVLISNTPAEAVPVRGVGRTILVADNLAVPGNSSVTTQWFDTSDCQRMLLVFRGIRGALVEFYTSMDGDQPDTWWTEDIDDNFNFVLPDGGAAATTFSFSYHGQQPAAAPWARVKFFGPADEPQTVEKAWIYCVR